MQDLGWNLCIYLKGWSKKDEMEQVYKITMQCIKTGFIYYRRV